MEGVVGIIWVIAIVAMIVKSAKKASGNARPGQSAANRPVQSAQRVYDAQQESMDRARASQTAANRPRQLAQASQSQYSAQQRAAYAQKAIREANQDRYGAAVPVGSSFGQVKAGSIGQNGVLLEDRKNDWLAKQLREEAIIYRRGVGFDLGAAHNVNCAADELKRGHVRVHNSNGLDRQTFR